MENFFEERTKKYQEFFSLESADLSTEAVSNFKLNPETAEKLKRFNIEWHFIPSQESLPFDENYVKRMYPTASREFNRSRNNGLSISQYLSRGHKRQQGYVVGIETTQKPCYLPKNRQFYGTQFGHDSFLDPFADYMGAAEMTNGTRFDHNYLLLRNFFEIVNKDWQKKNLIPEGYRVTLCPPAIFNLIGTVFHPEWSATETLEMSFYRDERGNATVFSVGANAPGDFSYVEIMEGEDELEQTGFRIALLPDETRFDADRRNKEKEPPPPKK